MSHHEMWRDEMAAYLLSRDSASLSDLIKNVRYEGHSILWYICLRLAHFLYGNVYSMQFLAAFISTISVFVFIKNSPFRLWQKLLFVFGFFQFYEYTVISRDYCLLLPLLFTFATLYASKVKNYIALSLVILSLSFVNIYALIAAGSLFLGLVYEFIFNTEKPSLSRYQLISFVCLTSLGLMTACYQITPPTDIYQGFSVLNPDITKNILSIFEWNPEYFAKLRVGFILGFVSVPVSGPVYWDGSSIFYPHYKFIFPLVVILNLYTFFLLRRQKALLLTYFIFISSIVIFSYAFYQGGSQRHFGILLVFWVIILWMANYKNCISLLKNPVISFSLSILLFLQFAGGIQATINEIKYKFSDGEALAHYLENNGYLDKGFIISAYPDWTGLSSIGYLPETTKFYYYHGRLFGTYNISDARRGAAPGLQDLACEAYQLSMKTNKQIVLILHKSLYGQDVNLINFKPIYISESNTTVSEDYVVLLIDSSSKNKILNCNSI